MQEEKPQVAPEDDMADLANDDLGSLLSKMRRVLKSMSKDGEVDLEEARMAADALFFLKCWEEAANTADAEKILGMDDAALKASTMFVLHQVLADPQLAKQEPQAIMMQMFIMGIFTGIEYQERKHA